MRCGEAGLRRELVDAFVVEDARLHKLGVDEAPDQFGAEAALALDLQLGGAVTFPVVVAGSRVAQRAYRQRRGVW